MLFRCWKAPRSCATMNIMFRQDGMVFCLCCMMFASSAYCPCWRKCTNNRHQRLCLALVYVVLKGQYVLESNMTHYVHCCARTWAPSMKHQNCKSSLEKSCLTVSSFAKMGGLCCLWNIWSTNMLSLKCFVQTQKRLATSTLCVRVCTNTVNWCLMRT